MTMTLVTARCEVRRKEELRGLSLAARVCGHCQMLFFAAKIRFQASRVSESCESIAHRNLYFYQILKLFSMPLANKII